jgi:HK97 family phage portal protein
MAGDLDRATWSNVEQQSIDFVVHTIGPWLVRWEQALSRDLLTDDEQQEYYFEFNVDGLLRGDIKTRYGAYAQGRQWGWLSINDVRARENMNKIENGDDYLSPTNMIPAWQVGEQEEKDDGPGKTPPTV